MSIGPDIKEVLQELGTEVTVLRSPTNFKEKITYEVDSQSSNPFMREFALTASMAYDTAIVSGDLLQFSGLTYMAASMTPDQFENETVEFATVLFKCNRNGFKIVYWNKSQDPVTYKITAGWSVRVASAYGLFYKDFSGNTIEPNTSAGKEPAFILKCLLPASYNVEAEDRIYLSSTEYYRVFDLVRYAYPGLNEVRLVEDNRGIYTP